MIDIGLGLPKPLSTPVIQGQDMIFPGLRPPQIDQFPELVRILLGQVTGFGKIFGHVIKLPFVLVKGFGC